MHKTEFVLKTETHKILLDFEIQASYLILCGGLCRRLSKNHRKRKERQVL